MVYIVSGATHPHIRRREGEKYRDSLRALANELGVSSHVIFNNRFVSAEELVEHVGAADIYITPYRQEAQVVSGTLAIALGAGKAIISTPYWHAKDLLADGRGVIVPFDDPGSIAVATIRLLDNDAERHAMRKRAYLHSRGTTWQKTAQAYMASFQRARVERMFRPRPALPDLVAAKAMDQLPRLNTVPSVADDRRHRYFAARHLFGPYCNEGYTTDDNARALIVSTLLNSSPLSANDEHLALSRRYLAFLWLAFNAKTGRFRNFLSYDREWLEEVGRRTAMAAPYGRLGKVLGNSQDAGLRGAAGRLFEAAVSATLTFTSPRAWAFCILGMQAYLDRFPGDRAIQGIPQSTCESASRYLRASSFSDVADGLRKAFPTPMRGCRRRLSWLDGEVTTENDRRGMDSLKWLVAEQHRGMTRRSLFRLAPTDFY